MVKTNKRREQDRRAAAAAKAAEMRRAQLAAERRRRTLIVSLSVVVAIAIVVVVAVLVATHKAKNVTADAKSSGATADYGFVVGQADAPVTMVAWEDFQCPHCEELESAIGPTIDQLVADGTLRVEYRPVAFLSAYSTRALNAAVCVNRAGGGAAFKKLHALLFAHQPPEGSDGLSNAQLTSYADQALGGQRPAVAACIDDGTFDSWGSSATEAFSKATSKYPSGASTPTLLLDGTLVSATDLASYLSDPAAFRTAVEKLAAG